jgi:hypothetical protein
MTEYVDMRGNIETDENPPRYVEPNYRYWPNPTSLEYCGRVAGIEYWWNSEGQPLDGAPRLRNILMQALTPKLVAQEAAVRAALAAWLQVAASPTVAPAAVLKAGGELAAALQAMPRLKVALAPEGKPATP